VTPGGTRTFHNKKEAAMSDRWSRIARAIDSFVENPITNLVKGVALLFIGLSEASRTFAEDLTERHLRVGHGLVIIGFFGILEALPHLIEGLEAGKRFAELRAQKSRPEHGLEEGQDQGSTRDD
jgi:hypothetical protein